MVLGSLQNFYTTLLPLITSFLIQWKSTEQFLQPSYNPQVIEVEKLFILYAF